MWVHELFKSIQMANEIWTRNYWKAIQPRAYSHISECELKIVDIFECIRHMSKVWRVTYRKCLYWLHLITSHKKKGLLGGFILSITKFHGLKIWMHFVYGKKKKRPLSNKCFYKDHLSTHTQKKCSCDLKQPSVTSIFML